MSVARTSAAEIEALLHPACAFRHPMDVVRDADLTLYEKRVIMSSWASDCAVEDFPEFRQPSGKAPVKFDDVMEALRSLDAELERRTDPNSTYDRPSGQKAGGTLGIRCCLKDRT
jgi:hypothetical protein